MNNKHSLNKEADIAAYNHAVKTAYFQLLTATKRLIATLEQHELRCTLQRTDKSKIAVFIIVHELISPIVYLSLKSMDGVFLSINWGFEQFDDQNDYSYITATFIRMLYNVTATEHTTMDIEDCINTDYVIQHCSVLYEQVEDNNHHHSFVLIKHKEKKARHSNRILSVA